MFWNGYAHTVAYLYELVVGEGSVQSFQIRKGGMGTQAKEKGIGTGSFKIQVNELIHNDKMRSYGTKSNHMQHLEEKSHDHDIMKE